MAVDIVAAFYLVAWALQGLYALGPHWSAGSCSNYNGGGPDGLAACERFGAVFTTLMGVYFGLAGFQG